MGKKFKQKKISNTQTNVVTAIKEHHLTNELITKAIFLRQRREELLSQQIYPLSITTTFASFYFVLARYLYLYFIFPKLQEYFLIQNEQLYNVLVNDADKYFGSTLKLESFKLVCNVLDSSITQLNELNVEYQKIVPYWFNTIGYNLRELIDDLVKAHINRRRLERADFASLEAMYYTYNEFLQDGKNTFTPSRLMQAVYNHLPYLVVTNSLFIGIPFITTQLLQVPIHYGIKKAYIKARNYYERSFSDKEKALIRDPSKLELPDLRRVVQELDDYNYGLEQNIRSISRAFKVVCVIAVAAFLYFIFRNSINLLEPNWFSVCTFLLIGAVGSDIKDHFNARFIAANLGSLEKFLYAAIPINELTIFTRQGRLLGTSALTISFEHPDRLVSAIVANALYRRGIKLYQERSNFLICYGSDKKFDKKVVEEIRAEIKKELRYYEMQPKVEYQISRIASALNKSYLYDPQDHDGFSYSFDLTGLPAEQIKLVFQNCIDGAKLSHEAPYLLVQLNACLDNHNLRKLEYALCNIRDEIDRTNQAVKYSPFLVSNSEKTILESEEKEHDKKKNKNHSSATISVNSAPTAKHEIKWKSVKYSADKPSKYLGPVINKPENRFFFFNKIKSLKIPEGGVRQVGRKGQGFCIIGPVEAQKAQRKYHLPYEPIGKYRFPGKDARIFVRREIAVEGGEVLYVAETCVEHAHKH